MYEEGNAKIIVKEKVFLNPNMEICRDFSSLFVGSIKEDLQICDGMCATGIRGIRYLLENDNVKYVAFVDNNKAACENVEENLKMNNIRNAKVINDDINHFLYLAREKFNFIEIDPFGSPVPFIRSALFRLREKGGYLSVTATDAPVLCGVHRVACENNYLSKPIHNYFCHETGIRILIGYIAKVAAPLHLGIEPLFSLSKRHFFKVFLKIKKGAKEANESFNNLGFIFWCDECFNTTFSSEPFEEKICICGNKKVYAGPLWIGKIFDEKVVEGMISENESKTYKNKDEIRKILITIREESKINVPYYFDLHEIFKKLKIPAKNFDEIIEKLKREDYEVSRTHFNQNAIKTNASAKKIFEVVEG
jgi:tRNA (guanine26-N2/guanine27-N2)-dimethyltransferase